MSIFYMLEKKVYQSLISSRTLHIYYPKLVNDIVHYHYFIASVFILIFSLLFLWISECLKKSLLKSIWLFECSILLIFSHVLWSDIDRFKIIFFFTYLLLELSHILYIHLSFSTDLAEISAFSPFTQQRWTNMFIT